jgi:amino acid transporter
MSSHVEVVAETKDLARDLGPWQATAVVISTIIGTGVFLVAGPMARAAGSADLVLATWVVGTAIALSGTLCFAELGAALPRAGGMFVYLSRGLNPLCGFLFGWMNSTLATPVSIATLAAGFVRFGSFLFPAIDSSRLVLHAGPYELTLTAAQPIAAGVVLILTAFNLLSVRVGGGVQCLLGSFKIGALVIIIAAGILFGGRGTTFLAPTSFPQRAGALGAVLSALAPVMWAYNGFQNLGFLGDEIRNPAKNFSRALLGGALLVGALYLLVHIIYFHVLPFATIANSQHVASDVVESLFGTSGGAWLTVAMATSAVACLHAVIMAEARVPYAMARRGLFFGFAARVQPRFHTPSGALLFLGSLGALIALTGTFEELYSLYVFAVWIFLGLAAAALMRLRATEPDLPRPYRVWGYPWTPLLFLVAALALTVNLWIERPIRSSLGLLVILGGVPFYFRWRARVGQLPPTRDSRWGET